MPTLPEQPRPPVADDALFGDDRLTLAGLLAETFTGLIARTMGQLAGFGVSHVEFEVLIRLARSPQGLLRMTDLAAQASLTASGATRVVDRLADRGLVCRRSCDVDRRTTYAVITEAGLTLMRAALPGHLEVLEEVLVAPLSGEGDRATFEALLRRLRDSAVPCATAGSTGTALDAVPTNR